MSKENNNPNIETLPNVSFINLSGIAKPIADVAIVLIDKFDKAICGSLRPWQLRRVAKAEADVSLIKKDTEMRCNSLERRASRRAGAENIQYQKNYEQILTKMPLYLNEKATPEKVNNDWIVHAFEKFKKVSDEEMQDLWARVIAGEANTPGKFSKRTINFIETLEKEEAELFTKLMQFGCDFGYPNNNEPLIFNNKDEIYTKNDINFSTLNHLKAIGLINFNPLTGIILTYSIPGVKSTPKLGMKKIWIGYKGNKLMLESEKDNLEIGKVTLTELGKELATLCNSEKNDDFLEYITKKYSELGYKSIVDSSDMEVRS